MINFFRKSPKLLATTLFATSLVFTSCEKNEELIETPVEQNKLDNFSTQARMNNQEGFHFGFPITEVAGNEIINIYEGNNRNADLTPVNLLNSSELQTIYYKLAPAFFDNSPEAEAHNWIPPILTAINAYQNALADLGVQFLPIGFGDVPADTEADLVFSYFNSAELSPVSGRFPESDGSIGRIINVNPLAAAFLNKDGDIKQSKFNFMIRALGQVLGFSPESAECELSFMTTSLIDIKNSTRATQTLTNEESQSIAKRAKLLYVSNNLDSFSSTPAFVTNIFRNASVVTRGYQSCPTRTDSGTTDNALNLAEILYNEAFNIQ
ncbi:hypothetical protein [Tenacibaculum amylolyticum]|uniref:hypothetical protein n=1 Tax=Tenacibaculum amylolyticum TaxID=104269 RepID=UPI003893AE45